MKFTLATALLLTTTATVAHDMSFSNDSCQVELEGGIKISKNEIVFSQQGEALYRIVNNSKLIVDGDNVLLTPSQQSIVTEYSTSIRQMVPQVQELAVDAIELATDGVNLAFNELLGEGNDVGAEITIHLATLKDKVDSKFSGESDIYIDENGFDGDDFFGEEFEQELEQAIEQTVENSIGTILIAVGQELIFSGGDMEAFEARMETFGEQIEQEMETRGEELEHRSEEICHAAVNIDQLEQQLSSAIPKLKDIDLINATLDERKSI